LNLVVPVQNFAGLVFYAADRILSLTFDLVGLTFGFGICIAGQLANAFFDLALDVGGGAFNAIFPFPLSSFRRRTNPAQVLVVQWNPVSPFTFPRMAKQIVTVEVLEEGHERFLRKTYADGSEERKPIVKEPRKRRPRRIDWSRKLSTGLKRGF